MTWLDDNGDRILPPPSVFDIDPIIPMYTKMGYTGHLYIVQLPNEPDIFKVGSTTQLLKRMYWYPPGTELLYCHKTLTQLRHIENMWIKRIKNDTRFTLVRGKEYFRGPYEEAINILEYILKGDGLPEPQRVVPKIECAP
jgi:hypothetical protein